MAASSLPQVYLAGATGLTGSATFQTLLSSPSLLSSLTTLTRRPLPSTESSKVSYHNAVLDLTNPSSWPSPWPVPNGGGAAVEGEGKKTFVSCLGTTKAAAGSLKEQEKVDLDMNLNLAKAAKEQGVETYILVSSGGASSSSYMPYSAMKGKLEDAVIALGFNTTFILQPALLIGARNETRTPEAIAQSLFSGLRSIGLPMGRMMVDAGDVGKCISKLINTPKEGVHYISNPEIIKIAMEA